MKHLKTIADFLLSFLIFFALVAFVITCSFFLFLHDFEMPREHLDDAAKITFVNVLILTFIFTVLDVLRRKYTVERPVQEIQSALDRITAGDFSVRLVPDSRYGSFSRIMDSINHMTRELSGVETLRNDFIANVSHEMKTPLAVIQNYGTLLQEPGLSEEHRITCARTITNCTRRLSNLMTNILKLNRLENQTIYPQPKPYDLSEQLCRCLLQFEACWEDNGIGIETDLPDELPIRMDEELLELVWNNLLSNAFKFTGPGGRVSLQLTAEGSAAVVRVSDTGCGMTAEVGAHIFEKFYQGDTSHATAGNGLGLALVKRIIDIVGGEISVSSAPGVGSTFTVRLRGAL